MEAEEYQPRADDPARLLAKQDLEPFSQDALRQRITTLEAEIERCRATIAAKAGTRSAAEALFGGR